MSCSHLLGRANVFGCRYGAAPGGQGTCQRVSVPPPAPRRPCVVLMVSINKARPADTSVAPE